MLKLSNLRMNAKMSLLLGLVGILPMLAVSGIAIWRSHESMARSADHANEIVEHQAFDQLEGVRDLKRRSVERYFSFLQDQIITLSDNRMTVQAMRDFRDAVDDLSTDDASQIAREDGSLPQYYRGPFANTYRERAGQGFSDVDRLWKGLDAKALLMQSAYISDNSEPLGEKHRLDRGDLDPMYDALHEANHPKFRAYLERFGYYDIFLVEPDEGRIVYSVFKELDYGTSMRHGPYADTGIAEAFRRGMELASADDVAVVDFAPYGPSYDAPASFLASPIFLGPERIGVLIFQAPLDRITEVMSDRTGLGETGESYLVGTDRLMRSDSYLDPENRSVLASFRNPSQGSVDTESVKKAFAGSAGVGIVDDYRGQPVLSAYAPVVIAPGVEWAILVEIDRTEAFTGVAEMSRFAAHEERVLVGWFVVIAGLFSVVVFAVGRAAGFAVSRPMGLLVDRLKDIAEGDGDLTQRVDVTTQDEIGDVAHWFNLFVERMQTAMRSIQETTNQLASSSAELSQVSTSLDGTASEANTRATSVSAATEQINQSIATVSSAAEQMRASIQEIASSSSSAAAIASEAVSEAKQTNEVVAELGVSSRQIGDVIGVITSIAEQTNLLALNATIEAARAGEAGKGFAVVANEVKELASQTAKATEEISSKVQSIQSDTEKSVVAIDSITTTIHRVDEFATSIAAAVEEQSATTAEISRNVNDGAQGLSEIAEHVEGVARASESTSSGAGETRTAAEDLSRAAAHLTSLVGDFRI